MTPLDTWAEARTGLLSSLDEAELAEALHVSQWSKWSGEHIPREGAADADAIIFLPQMRSSETILCYGGCGWEPVPEALQVAGSRLFEVAHALWSKGNAVDGSVRFVAVREDPAAAQDYFEWPLDRDLDLLALTEANAAQLSWGAGHLATGSEAHALRELRDLYRNSTAHALWPHIPVRAADGKTYKVFLRDELPYSEDTGLIRPK